MDDGGGGGERASKRMRRGFKLGSWLAQSLPERENGLEFRYPRRPPLQEPWGKGLSGMVEGGRGAGDWLPRPRGTMSFLLVRNEARSHCSSVQPTIVADRPSPRVPASCCTLVARGEQLTCHRQASVQGPPPILEQAQQQDEQDGHHHVSY